MHFKSLISIWALLALLLGQFALAQHSASHIDHGFAQEIATFHDDHNDDDHDHPKNKHSCPECILTKSLQTAFYNTPDIVFIHFSAENYTFSYKSKIVVGAKYKAHSPRAPPVFLI